MADPHEHPEPHPPAGPSAPASSAAAAGGALESIVNSFASLPFDFLEAGKTLMSAAKHAFNYGMLIPTAVAGFVLAGPAAPITGAAMMAGRLVVDWKDGKETDWNDLPMEGLKGTILGTFATWMYKHVINIIPNQTIIGKVGRTLAYNPGFVSGIYNPAYLHLTQALQGKEIPAGEWGRLNRDSFFFISPAHFLTTNFLKSSQEQAIASAALGNLYRIIAG